MCSAVVCGESSSITPPTTGEAAAAGMLSMFRFACVEVKASSCLLYFTSHY
jgi:hypothetical protein